MPYRTIKELPTTIQNNLPLNAQELYKNAFNHAVEEFESTHDYEHLAHKVAWGAVKQKYHMDESRHWVPNEGQGTRSHTSSQYRINQQQETLEGDGSTHSRSEPTQQRSYSDQNRSQTRGYQGAYHDKDEERRPQNTHEGRGQTAQHRERDEHGRFLSEHEDDNRNRTPQARSSGAYSASNIENRPRLTSEVRSQASTSRERDELDRRGKQQQSSSEKTHSYALDYEPNEYKRFEEHDERHVAVQQHRQRDEQEQFGSESDHRQTRQQQATQPRSLEKQDDSTSTHEGRRDSTQHRERNEHGQFVGENQPPHSQIGREDRRGDRGNRDRGNRNHEHHPSNT